MNAFHVPAHQVLLRLCKIHQTLVQHVPLSSIAPTGLPDTDAVSVFCVELFALGGIAVSVSSLPFCNYVFPIFSDLFCDVRVMIRVCVIEENNGQMQSRFFSFFHRPSIRLDTSN